MPKMKTLTIHQIEDDPSPHFYVISHASRIAKTPSHVLIPYTSKQSGDKRSIEVPMTGLPFDLANYVPKEELIMNTELRRLVGEGYLDIVDPHEAALALATPSGLAERDRLAALKHVRNRVERTSVDDGLTPEQLRAQNQNQPLDTAQTGDFDRSAENVQSSVVTAMEQTAEEHRLPLLQSLAPMMTEADRKYVRARTEDPDIRKLVAGPAA